MHGSVDSPYKWFESFTNFVTAYDEYNEKCQNLGKMGFELEGGTECADERKMRAVMAYAQGMNEPCVFYNRKTGMRLALFVDDVISKGSHSETVKFYEMLNEKYPLRSWDILSENTPLVHLGYKITEEVIDGKTYRYMSQEDDVIHTLNEADIHITKHVGSPMPERDSILKDSRILNKDEKSYFKSLVGSLSFYAISLRWDIAHSVARVQQFNESPTKGALNAAIRIAMYVGCTSNFRLGGEVQYGDMNDMTYYADSDHAGDMNMCLYSHSGCIFLMNGVPIHWRSKKQPVSVISPAHAEIFAASEALTPK